MTHHTDILGLPPKMRPIMPPEDPPCDDWTGESLIRSAPARAPQPPAVPEMRKGMHWKERRPIVEAMHRQGKDITEIMRATGSVRETIGKDLKELGLFVASLNIRGDYEKGLAVYRAFCKRRKVSMDLIRDTKKCDPYHSNMRGDCLLAIQEASGASPAMLERITGIPKTSTGSAIKRAIARRAGA